MTLTASDLRGAAKKYDALPASEKEAIDKKMAKINADVERHEEEKFKDGRRMIQALSKEASGYVHSKIVNDVGFMRFNGLGEGKKVKCCICREHDSVMSNKANGKWYCQTHVSLWNLPEDEQEHERSKYVTQ